ncbi:MAG: 30S ribosome-binding factor RbfA [Planctomycetota bacterium]
MSQRAEQAAGLIREAIQKVIAEGLHDPRIRGLITVTRVTVSDDLRSATVYVSVMPEEQRDLTMHGLTAAAKHIRHAISDKLALRVIPGLAFKPDLAAARQAKVLDALADVARERSGDAEASDAWSPTHRRPAPTDSPTPTDTEPAQ